MRQVALLVLLLPLACGDVPRTPAPAADAENLPLLYQLDAPDAAIDLAPELREISGLTILPSGRLGAIQDEDGTIFELDPATGAIVDRLTFAGPGDYEGIELVPDRAVWVLRSDGDLFRVARDSIGAPTVELFETALRSRNDTEGLAYDPVSDRLLIACKEWPGEDPETGENYRGVRTIYAFDLATRTLDARPVAFLPRELLDSAANFRPSALAVHPITGEWYVLSSVRQALAVVGTDGSVRTVADLPDALAPQPEGLAFASDGTLFVASEGPTGPGRLLRYSPVR